MASLYPEQEKMMMIAPSATLQRVLTAAATPPTVTGILAVAESLGVVAISAAAVSPWSERFLRRDPVRFDTTAPPPATSTVATFVRSLFVPGLVEELFWRVLLQPPGLPWQQGVLVNALFTAYHPVASAPLSRYGFPQQHEGAPAVFSDPVFLLLAFVLGNNCSYAYVRSGHALWAPVVVHAVSVTVWLSCLGGQEALSTSGGLSKRRKE
jgi:predicted Abi (CAAX) family protease